MSVVRAGLHGLFSFLFLLLLIAAALSTSANITLGTPQKTEQLLAKAKVYDNLSATLLTQAQAEAGNSELPVSLTNPDVLQAARVTLSQSVLKPRVDQVVQSHYDWLAGKRNAPITQIDLSDAKHDFAGNVAKLVEARLQSLPACSAAQAAQLRALAGTDIDPLAISCRPAILNPATEAVILQRQIESSPVFLSNTAIDISGALTDQGSQSKPYYTRFEGIQTAYKIGRKLPVLAGTLAVVCLVAVLATARTRQKGTRHGGTILFIGGLALVIASFAVSLLVNYSVKHALADTGSSNIQQALTEAARLAGASIVKINLAFGAAYIILAAVFLFAARFFRGGRRSNGKRSSRPATASATPTAEPLEKDQPGPAAVGTDPAQNRPSKQRPPRLIQ